MPFLKLHAQFVWATKSKMSFLVIKEMRKIIWNKIKTNAKKNEICLDFINGYSDYYHCLIALKDDQTIEKVIEILNKEKTYWIDKKGISSDVLPDNLESIFNTETNNIFQWQHNYFIIAVSQSVFERMSRYTRNQLVDKEEKLFDKEYNDYAIKFEFKNLQLNNTV